MKIFESMRFFLFTQTRTKTLIFFVYFGAIHALLLSANGIFLGKGIDNLENAPSLAMLLFCVFLCLRLCMYLTQYLADKSKISLTVRMETTIRNRLYRAILLSDWKWWDKQDDGEVKEMLTDQMSEAANDVATLVQKFIEVIIGLVSAVIAAFIIDAFVACLICLYFPLAVYASICVGKKCVDTHESRQASARAEVGVLDGLLHGAREIILYNKQRYFRGRGTDAIHQASHETSKHLNRVALYRLMEEISKSVGFIAILFIGFARSQIGEATLGSIIILIGLADNIFLELSQINYVHDLYASVLGFMKTFTMLLHAPQHPFGQEEINVKGSPAIKLQNVSLAYDEDECILRDVSLIVYPSEHVAVTGASGSGKTSILHMAMQLYTPNEGEVILFGMRASHLAYESICTHMAAVTQFPYIFHASCYHNIAWGNERCDAGEVRTAAVLAGFPKEGLDEFLCRDAGERGSLLSGGERQRIALARCFLRNADIILLDEPTSMVDAETQRIIMMNIAEQWKNRTLLIASHQSDVNEYVDRVVKVGHDR